MSFLEFAKLERAYLGVGTAVVHHTFLAAAFHETRIFNAVLFDVGRLGELRLDGHLSNAIVQEK